MQKLSTPPRRSQVERTDATRAALLGAARALFEARGFAGTGTPEIVAAAQVTRGALYHHFADKTELFHAVAQQVAQEVADEIARQSKRRKAPVEALLAGAQAYFAAMADAGRARLLLLEAPAVLSAEQVMALNEIAGFEALQEGLREAVGDRQPPFSPCLATRMRSPSGVCSLISQVEILSSRLGGTPFTSAQ